MSPRRRLAVLALLGMTIICVSLPAAAQQQPPQQRRVIHEPPVAGPNLISPGLPGAQVDPAPTGEPDLDGTLRFLTQHLNDEARERYEFLVREDDPCVAICGYRVKDKWLYHHFSPQDIAPESLSARRPNGTLQYLRFQAANGGSFKLEIFDTNEKLLDEKQTAEAQCVIPVPIRTAIQRAFSRYASLCR